MINTTRLAVIALATSISGPIFAQQPQALARPLASKGSVLVCVDPTAAGKGLNVVAPIKVSAASRWPVKFSVSVVNLLEQEVFLTVSGIEWMSLEYELERELPDGAIEELLGSGATGAPLFPDNTGLLKRLHACHYKDGKASPCGCAIARIRGTFGNEDDPLDLRTVIGTHGKITIPIRGYFRANGKAFSHYVKVPIIVVEEPVANAAAGR